MTSGDDAPAEPGGPSPQDPHPQGAPPYPQQDASHAGAPPYPPPPGLPPAAQPPQPGGYPAPGQGPYPGPHQAPQSQAAQSQAAQPQQGQPPAPQPGPQPQPSPYGGPQPGPEPGAYPGAQPGQQPGPQSPPGPVGGGQSGTLALPVPNGGSSGTLSLPVTYGGGQSGSQPPPGPYGGAQPGAYPGGVPGGWPSPPPNVYPGAQPGPQPGPESGAYPGAQQGQQPGSQSGSDPGAHPGAQPGAQAQPGAYSGAPGGQAGPSMSNPYPYPPQGGQAASPSVPSSEQQAQGGQHSSPYANPYAQSGQGAQQVQGWQPATPPPPELWQMPTQPSAPARRGWVLPVAAVAAVVVVAGGTFTFMTVRQSGTSGKTGPTAQAQAEKSASAAPVTQAADVCSMLDPDEAERLVPQAKIDSSTSDNRGGTLVSYVRYTCGWVNRNISYKDVIRSREITVHVSKYEAIGTTTAEKAARIQFDGELRQYKYQADHSDKEHYYSPVQEYPGVGDAAAAQYQWTREGDKYWYSFGQGVGRVGDVVFEVKYEASQKKKEADIFSAETTQSITEENALREVKNLLTQVAKSVTAWRAGKPLPYHARPKPSPSPSPSPTPIPLPKACVSLKPLAATLVPQTEGAAVRNKEGNSTVTQCQWWNDKLPVGGGKVRWRNLRIAVHSFWDEDSARYYLIDQRSKTKFTESSQIGGIRWGKVEKLTGFGQEAFGQAIRQRTDTAQSNRYEIYARDGKNVIWVLLSGSDRPENTPINAPDSVLMDPKEAKDGAKSVAKALLGAL